MSGITGFFHGGITVRDMDRSLEFYESGLGLTVEFDRLAASPYLKEVLGLEFEELRIVYLRIPNAPGSFVELLEYRGLNVTPPPPARATTAVATCASSSTTWWASMPACWASVSPAARLKPWQ
jgi:catechol 2,3-dioxygenase-like lactoylglutathione lyase family enzyme